MTDGKTRRYSSADIYSQVNKNGLNNNRRISVATVADPKLKATLFSPASNKQESHWSVKRIDEERPKAFIVNNPNSWKTPQPIMENKVTNSPFYGRNKDIKKTPDNKVKKLEPQNPPARVTQQRTQPLEQPSSKKVETKILTPKRSPTTVSQKPIKPPSDSRQVKLLTPQKSPAIASQKPTQQPYGNIEAKKLTPEKSPAKVPQKSIKPYSAEVEQPNYDDVQYKIPRWKVQLLMKPN